MAGEDDDLTISGRLEGDLADQLDEIDDRLGRVEHSLTDVGRAGKDAGSDVAAGATKAQSGLSDVESAADQAAESLESVRDRAARGARSLRDTGEAAGEAGDGLSSTAKNARAAADGLDETGDKGRHAAGGLDAAAVGAETAADELRHTAREARAAGRALDDAGDEATTSGAKAAGSALLWERLTARLDRGERMSRRWAATQDAMRWSSWTSRVGKFVGGFKGVTSIDYDATAKKVSNLGKKFGGFGKVLGALKFMALAQGLYVVLGLVSALGAGAVGAVGGLASMGAGLAALAPLALMAKIAMIGVKAALKECQPETDALKKKFEGFGTSIAAGGLRSGLKSFTQDASGLAGRLNTLGKEIGNSSRLVLEEAGAYIKSREFLQRYGVIVGQMPGSLLNMAYAGLSAGKILVTGMAAASPAANELSHDVLTLVNRWKQQADALYESGRMTQVITQGYYNLRRALGVVADWAVGLFRIFKIGAQESSWMGDSIEASAQKFRDWTGSLEGQNAIRDYFQNAMPAIREAGLLVRDIVIGIGSMATNQNLAPLLSQIRTELVPALLGLAQNLQGNLVPGLIDMATNLARIFSGLDFSGLQVLVDGLNAFLRLILWAQQNIPGFNFILSTLLMTMFLMGPVASIAGKLFGVFGKFGKAFTWIKDAKAGGESLSFLQRVMGPLFRGIGMIAGWFGNIIGRVLMFVFQAFMRLGGVMGILRMIGAAFMAVVGVLGWPVTLIILLVVAVVGAFTWLWFNCDWFRQGVIDILTAVGQFFVSLWLDYIWPSLKAIGDFFVWLWESVLWPVISAIWLGLRILAAVFFVVLVAPFLIAVAIITGVAWLLWTYVFQPLFSLIADICVWLFYNVIMPAVNFFVWLWGQACAGVSFAYYAWIVPALQALGALFTWIFYNMIMPAVDLFVWLWGQACAGISFAYNAWIVPALQALGALFTWIFYNMIMPVVNIFVWLWNMACAGVSFAYYAWIVPTLNTLAAMLNWLYLNVWTPIVSGILWLWNGLAAGLSFVYYTLIQPAFDALVNGLNVVKGWFDSIVAGIGAVWGGLRGLLAAPVNFMINAVWNNGIVKAWNWAADLLGLAKAQPMAPIPENARGGIIPGPATPGRDTRLSWVGGREAVMRSEFTDAVGDERIYRWNHLARTGGAAAVRADMLGLGTPSAATLASWANPAMRSGAFGLPAFAGGGIMAPTQASSGKLPDIGSADKGSSLGDWARSAIADITDPLINLLPGAPPEWLGAVQAFPRKIRDSVVDYCIKKLEEMMSLGGGGVGGLVWAPVIALALGLKGQPQNLNPVVGRRLNQESGGNPFAVNLWDSNARRGTPSVGLMQVIGPTYRAYADRRYDVGPYMFGTSVNPLANILASMGYAISRYGNLSAAYNKAGGYDSGGYLQPGWTPVFNGTGKPEPVFTSGQWDLLSSSLPSLHAMNGGDLVSAMLATPQTSEAMAASYRDTAAHHEITELGESVRELAAAVFERPPPMNVFGDEVRRVVRDEMDAYQRRQRARRRYRYGED